jgi:excisionase family DNA binding protein
VSVFRIKSATMDRKEAARYLGVGLSALNELTISGTLPSFTIGRRRLYRRATLDLWLIAQESGSNAV